MILVDTSVWIDVLRDSSQERRKALNQAVGDREVVLTRFVQLELLQGCRDEGEWALLGEYLAAQDYVEMGPETWAQAARIYFELRRRGLTVRSPIDCCIAQLALGNAVPLLHRDRDFEVIGRVRPELDQQWLDWP